MKQSRGTVTGKTGDFTRHMRLISVTHRRRHLREAVGISPFGEAIKKALETKNRLKQFRTIANRSGKSPVKLSFTDADRAAELRQSAMRMLSKPARTRQNGLVGWNGRSDAVREKLRENKFSDREVLLLANAVEGSSSTAFPKKAQRHGAVEQFASGNTENTWRLAWTQARTGDPGS